MSLFGCELWGYQGTALAPFGQESRACKSNSPGEGVTCGKEDVATEGVETLPPSLGSVPCVLEPSL